MSCPTWPLCFVAKTIGVPEKRGPRQNDGRLEVRAYRLTKAGASVAKACQNHFGRAGSCRNRRQRSGTDQPGNPVSNRASLLRRFLRTCRRVVASDSRRRFAASAVAAQSYPKERATVPACQRTSGTSASPESAASSACYEADRLVTSHHAAASPYDLTANGLALV